MNGPAYHQQVYDTAHALATHLEAQGIQVRTPADLTTMHLLFALQQALKGKELS